MIEETPDENVEISPNDIIVEKDATFGRYVADHGLIFHMGRDIEIAFLQFGPSVRAKRAPESDIRSSFLLGQSMTEVARVRVSPSVATAMAIGILDDVIQNEDVNVEALREAIDKMIARAPVGDEDFDSDESVSK